ncbi:MAG: DUF2088 domain-containing protein [Thermoguttaceae bacterium]|nr:DUF2088 domain-containing protein [Thermoguttaceae bacterium]
MKQILQKAFDEAVNFPPLSEVVFEGDSVVIVPDAYIVEHGHLLAALVEHLLEAGCKGGDLTILLTAGEFERETHSGRLRALLPEKVRGEEIFEGFYPARPNACAILAQDDEGNPIMMARTLVEADVVLPIERYYPEPPLGHFGFLSALVPRFADSDVQTRFQSADSDTKREKIVHTLAPVVADLAYRLGTAMAIEVMIGGDGQVEGAVFGRVDELRERYAPKAPPAEQTKPESTDAPQSGADTQQNGADKQGTGEQG